MFTLFKKINNPIRYKIIGLFLLILFNIISIIVLISCYICKFNLNILYTIIPINIICITVCIYLYIL